MPPFTRQSLCRSTHVLNTVRAHTSFRYRHDAAASHQQQQRPLPAFCFDIDGVLLQGSKVLDEGKRVLQILDGDNSLRRQLPFVFLTNGGGVPETARVKKLQQQLDYPVRLEQVIQAHTPFERFVPALKDKPILVVGGEGENCKQAAYAYGFNEVYNPDDLMRWDDTIWPFASGPGTPSLSSSLPDFSKVHFAQIFVYNDSRNWGRDAQIITDVAASQDGCIYNPKDIKDSSQWTADKQIPVHWSNPDIIWKANFDLPRLGQGAFQTATQAVFKAVTSHDLHVKTYGKPLREIYDYAEQRLLDQAKALGVEDVSAFYMTGDNPASDIAGANGASERWHSMLVETGVHEPRLGAPAHTPTIQKPHVLEAVLWALEREGISAKA